MYVEVRGSVELYVAIRRCPQSSAAVRQLRGLGLGRACRPAEQPLSCLGELGQAPAGSQEKNPGADPPSGECP